MILRRMMHKKWWFKELAIFIDFLLKITRRFSPTPPQILFKQIHVVCAEYYFRESLNIEHQRRKSIVFEPPNTKIIRSSFFFHTFHYSSHQLHLKTLLHQIIHSFLFTDQPLLIF